MSAAGQTTKPAYVKPRPGFQIRFASVVDGKVVPNRIASTHVVQRWDGDSVVFRNRAVTSNTNERYVNVNKSWRGALTYSLHRVGKGIIYDKVDRLALERFWPFTVGKSLTMRSKRFVGAASTLKASWEKAAHTTTIVQRWRVLRRETITVPAGRFDTIVVERRWELLDLEGKRFEAGTRLFWFAPSIGWIVKLEFEITEGDAKALKSGIEALSIRQPR